MYILPGLYVRNVRNIFPLPGGAFQLSFIG